MIRVALITVSNKNSADNMLNEEIVEDLLKNLNGEEVYCKHVTEDFRILQEELFKITEKGLADLVLTTGGTGLARENITPEATMAVIEKETPGITELMRQKTAKKFPDIALSRGRAGIRKSTLIINLPDEEKQIIESLKSLFGIIPQGVEVLKRDYMNHRYHELKLW